MSVQTQFFTFSSDSSPHYATEEDWTSLWLLLHLVTTDLVSRVFMRRTVYYILFKPRLLTSYFMLFNLKIA